MDNAEEDGPPHASDGFNSTKGGANSKSKPKHNEKSVCFVSTPPSHSLHCRWELTDDLVAKLWYTDDESADMESESERVVNEIRMRKRGTRKIQRRPGRGTRSMKEGQMSTRAAEIGSGPTSTGIGSGKEKDLTNRGLEQRVSHHLSYNREMNRRKIVSAVLEAQKRRRRRLGGSEEDENEERVGEYLFYDWEGIAAASLEISSGEREIARIMGEQDAIVALMLLPRLKEDGNRERALGENADSDAPGAVRMTAGDDKSGAKTSGKIGRENQIESRWEEEDRRRGYFSPIFSHKLDGTDTLSLGFGSLGREHPLKEMKTDGRYMASNTEQGKDRPTPTLETDSVADGKRRQRVCFAPPTSNSVITVPGRWKLSDVETDALWYSQENIDAMYSNVKRAITNMHRSKLLGDFRALIAVRDAGVTEAGVQHEWEEEEESCSRGLEHMVSARTQYIREINHRRVTESVLEAQQESRRAQGKPGSGSPEEYISAEARRYSSPAAKRALEMGWKDAEELMRLEGG